MFEESPLFIDVLAFASHKGYCFEEILAKPLATIKGDFHIWSRVQEDLHRLVRHKNHLLNADEFADIRR